MIIRQYQPEDEEAVVVLWQKCGLAGHGNDSKNDIALKMAVSPELLLVGVVEGEVAATVMGGYEGHRGWINYLAVDPARQKTGLGRQMMAAIEKKLLSLGCPKINLQVRAGNETAVEFYRKIGYKTEERTSLGKRLIADT